MCVAYILGCWLYNGYIIHIVLTYVYVCALCASLSKLRHMPRPSEIWDLLAVDFFLELWPRCENDFKTCQHETCTSTLFASRGPWSSKWGCTRAKHVWIMLTDMSCDMTCPLGSVWSKYLTVSSFWALGGLTQWPCDLDAKKLCERDACLSNAWLNQLARGSARVFHYFDATPNIT